MAEPAAGAQTARAWKSFSVGAKFYPVPMEKPPLFDYYGDVYGPGPMILFRQLEVLSSRAQVLDALASVLGSPRALSVDELVAALAEKTGLDLSSYTTAWIKGTGAPVFPRAMVTFTEPSTLHVVITTAPEKRCKFSVALTDGAANRMIVPVDTFRNGVDQTLTVNPGFTVTTTEIDPNSECLIRGTAFAPEIRVPNPWRGEKPR
jgi:aminopeptidase N